MERPRPIGATIDPHLREVSEYVYCNPYGQETSMARTHSWRRKWSYDVSAPQSECLKYGQKHRH
jgi:hypothetical protein